MVGMGHDTVNQLLAEMDGFKSTEGILVLAATNFKVRFLTAMPQCAVLMHHEAPRNKAGLGFVNES